VRDIGSKAEKHGKFLKIEYLSWGASKISFKYILLLLLFYCFQFTESLLNEVYKIYYMKYGLHYHISLHVSNVLESYPPITLSYCLSLPLSPSISLRESSLISSSFPHPYIPHMRENMWHLSLWECLISLLMVIFSSIHFCAIQTAHTHTHTHTHTHILFIHSSIHGHLGWFHNLAITNSAA
jgi:hypothetical protein